MLTAAERKREKEDAAAHRMRERCIYFFADGRRCTSLRGDDHPNFCPHHAQKEHEDNNNVQYGAELIAPEEALDTGRAINAYLARVARAAGTRRITPKHAAIMGYLGQLMLQSLIHIRKEDELADAAQPQLPAPALGPGLFEAIRQKIDEMPDLPDPLFEDDYLGPIPKPQAQTAPPDTTCVRAVPNPRDHVSPNTVTAAAPTNGAGSAAPEAAAPREDSPASPDLARKSLGLPGTGLAALPDALPPLELGLLENLCTQLGLSVVPPAPPSPPAKTRTARVARYARAGAASAARAHRPAPG